jgi:hypothetical protein
MLGVQQVWQAKREEGTRRKMRRKRGAKERLPWRKIAMMNESPFSMHGKAFGVEKRSSQIDMVLLCCCIERAVNRGVGYQRKPNIIRFEMRFQPNLSSFIFFAEVKHE